MKIAILGTGTVGETVGSKLIELGHEVMMGSRNAKNEKSIAFVEKNGTKASAGTFADASAFGEIIINCTAGGASLNALKLAGENNLNHKVMIDIANPLIFQWYAPSLQCYTNSLGKKFKKLTPRSKL